MRFFLVTALFTTVLAQTEVRTTPTVVSEVGTIPPSTVSTQTSGPTYIIAVSKCITPGLMADVSVDMLNRANPVAIMTELYDKRTGEVYGTSRATINPEHPQVISVQVPKDLNSVGFNNYYIRVTGVGTGVNFTDEAAVSVRTRNVSGFVQTDKAVYKPGDTVQYRIFSLFPDLKVNKAAYKVEIRDPKRNKIRYDRNLTDPTGLIRGSLSLSDEPLPGVWVIDVTLEGTSTRFRKQFEVKEYGDLLDHTDVKSNDIVPGGILQIRVWDMWRDLIEAVASNDIDKVFSLGVTQDTDYKTPVSEYMTKRARVAWLADRAFVALCLAAHRGHTELVDRLIKSGTDINSSTPNGRTPLHLAAAQGHGQIVDSLLQNGADIDAADDTGMTALMRAEQFGHKLCGRHLFLFRWQQRAKKMQPSVNRPLMAHQLYDSAYPVWRSGQRCQLYVTKLPPPGEFDGSRINSKPYQPYSEKSFRKRFGTPPNLQTIQPTTDASQKHDIRIGHLPLPDIGDGPSNYGLPSLQQIPPSYDVLMDNLKEKERKIVLKKKREEERLKLQEEDRKRAEAEKNQSYESWLLQQEADKRKDNEAMGPDENTQDSASGAGNVAGGGPRKGALREYLESLADRKTGSAYSEWLIRKEIEMLDSVQARPVLKTK